MADDDDNDRLSWKAEIESAKNDGISCELGIRYPTLQSIMSGNKNILSIQVIICYISCYMPCYIQWFRRGRVH